MKTLAKIAARFNTSPSSLLVDDNSGFATSFKGQPASGWTVAFQGAVYDVWTDSKGDVLCVLPA